jgi:hypothetical protein
LGEFVGYQLDAGYVVLFPRAGEHKTIFNPVVVKASYLGAHSYCECELICSETATYSQKANARLRGITADAVTPNSNR